MPLAGKAGWKNDLSITQAATNYNGFDFKYFENLTDMTANFVKLIEFFNSSIWEFYN
jgi:hypothetical protein